jgi:hypothetical protein
MNVRRAKFIELVLDVLQLLAIYKTILCILWVAKKNFIITHLSIQGTYNVNYGQIKTNMTIPNVVITLWVLFTKYLTITFLVNSSDYLPWPPIQLHELPIVGADKNKIICSKFHTTNYTKFDTKFLEPTLNNHDIGLALETTLNQKINIIFIQVPISL